MSPSYQSKRKNKIKLIIFDLDGVLADSFSCFYPLIRDGMASVGISISENQYKNLFKENIHKALENFINNSKQHLAFVKFRSEHYDQYYRTHYPKLFPGTIKTLDNLKKHYFLSIASSGKIDNIQGLLKKNGIYDLFDAVLATSDHTKEKMIMKILAEFKVRPKETIMITDTTGDINIAKKVGLKTIAVSWGFHGLDLLLESKPDCIANNFRELKLSVKSLT